MANRHAPPAWPGIAAELGWVCAESQQRKRANRRPRRRRTIRTAPDRARPRRGPRCLKACEVKSRRARCAAGSCAGSRTAPHSMKRWRDRRCRKNRCPRNRRGSACDDGQRKSRRRENPLTLFRDLGGERQDLSGGMQPLVACPKKCFRRQCSSGKQMDVDISDAGSR